jgi:hypothetical protein
MEPKLKKKKGLYQILRQNNYTLVVLFSNYCVLWETYEEKINFYEGNTNKKTPKLGANYLIYEVKESRPTN